MKIYELLGEQSPADQIAKDAALIAQHQRQQWLKQQQSQQQPQQPTAAPVAPAAPEIKVTPDMIAKHPQYKSWYDKYYKAEFAKDGNPASASSQAKKYADSKIASLIRAGK
jgi:hypothetical protein